MATPLEQDAFIINTPLDTHVEQMPMLRIRRAEAILQQQDGMKQFEERMRIAMAQFELTGEPTVGPERALSRQGDVSLEIFRASDSIWWTNHQLANLDAPDGAVELPPEADAIALAKSTLAKLGLDDERPFVDSVTYTEASNDAPENSAEPVRTAMDVNFSFRASNLPIFGPGAKVKVTFGHKSKLVQLVYFMRKYDVMEEPFAPITPLVALERYRHDEAFLGLGGTGSKVVIERMRLGYLALPPAEFQRFYTPVYAVDAVAATPRHERHVSRTYIPARDLSRTDITSRRSYFDSTTAPALGISRQL